MDADFRHTAAREPRSDPTRVTRPAVARLRAVPHRVLEGVP
ncbi:hypothetical protein [Nocardia cyriacigeorgica]|nr:hypothetical protein [Nocardia cyriacigeorgica]